MGIRGLNVCIKELKYMLLVISYLISGEIYLPCIPHTYQGKDHVDWVLFIFFEMQLMY